MKRFPLRFLATSATILCTLLSSGQAYAQYVWLDERGIKQYSDMPPPASIPASRILKQPGGTRISANKEATSTGTEPSTSTSTSRTEMTIAERNAEFRKRQAERTEKEKKAAEEEKVAMARNKHCEQVRDYHRALESGQRIARMDNNGERQFLTDEQREREMRDTRRTMAECN